MADNRSHGTGEAPGVVITGALVRIGRRVVPKQRSADRWVLAVRESEVLEFRRLLHCMRRSLVCREARLRYFESLGRDTVDDRQRVAQQLEVVKECLRRMDAIR